MPGHTLQSSWKRLSEECEEQKILNCTSSLLKPPSSWSFRCISGSTRIGTLTKESSESALFWEIILQRCAEFNQLFLVMSAHKIFPLPLHVPNTYQVLQKFQKKSQQNSAHSTRSHLESTIDHLSPTKVQWWDIKWIFSIV